MVVVGVPPFDRRAKARRPMFSAVRATLKAGAMTTSFWLMR
jgi:hypothetical protein